MKSTFSLLLLAACVGGMFVFDLTRQILAFCIIAVAGCVLFGCYVGVSAYDKLVTHK